MNASSESLILAIRGFQGGIQAFNDMPSEVTEACQAESIAATYGPYLAALQEWTEPAQTREGAVEALRLAVAENEDCDGSPVANRMVRAALAYFEREPGQLCR